MTKSQKGDLIIAVVGLVIMGISLLFLFKLNFILIPEDPTAWFLGEFFGLMLGFGLTVIGMVEFIFNPTGIATTTRRSGYFISSSSYDYSGDD